MPIKHITYECNICHSEYSTLVMATDCENKGIATEYPIGLIYNFRRTDNGWGKITFAVARNSLREHFNYISQWATRDGSPYGDNLDENICGGDLNPLTEWHTADRTRPTYKRMAEWLKSQGMAVQYWGGEKAVLDPDYL